MGSLVFGVVCIAIFQVFFAVIVHKTVLKLRTRVEDLEDTPRKLRRIPKELDELNWLTSALPDGTEICTIEYVTQLNKDAMDYYNKIMRLLGTVHAQIYQNGTWIKLPEHDPAALRISWYKDLMKSYPDEDLSGNKVRTRGGIH